MKFIDSIVEKENKFLKALEVCRDNGLKTYIFGNGEGADNLERRAGDFVFAGRLVNRKYYADNKDVECIEDLLAENTEKINVVIGCRGIDKHFFDEFEEKIELIVDYDCFSGNYSVDPVLMTYEYIKEHEVELQSIYEELADDYSRDCLAAYINQKISMDYKYLRAVKTAPQYFEDFVPLSENEVLVDCGAYDGDSALSFIEELKHRNIKTYKGIISFEPDPFNFEKLCKRGFNNHLCINKGTADKAKQLRFSVLGTSSGIADEGEIVVEIDSLDNMVTGPVSFIKMDIEGAELDSLKGAEKMIKTNKPNLAICIYHKKEDLWSIQQYIKSLVAEYRFYIRAYEDTTTELVLYAII